METRQSARMTAAWPWISTAARLGLAAVWLGAGLLKIGDLAGSGRAVNAYEIFPYEVAKVIGAALPFLEITLGLLLLAGIAVRLIAGISAALLLIFIAGISWAWSQGLQIDCGCFSSGGTLSAGQAPQYLLDVVRDLGFLLLAGILLAKPRTRYSIDGVLMGEE
ncbi:MauE/DoxX family redox-associated membrane protein [Actinoplanes sp. NPDC049668]|uniref:MauE/DoxX family redox-associated membrane protein n=1 Tax=unclassified Actinoplanes TaxID=2626549 RepID=UPI0033BE2661